jgi:hypothetical protein
MGTFFVEIGIPAPGSNINRHHGKMRDTPSQRRQVRNTKGAAKKSGE